eukprot:510054_1
MPTRKARKRNKTHNNKQNKNTSNVAQNKENIPTDMYETDPNKWWINVRFWSHTLGILTALLSYYFTTFHKHLTIKGNAQKLIGPFVGGNKYDRDCVSLNTFNKITIIVWSFHFLRRLFETFCIQRFYRYAPLSEITGSIMYYGCSGLFNGVCNNIYIWFREDWKCPLMPNIALGLSLFCMGECGNCYHHYLIENNRNKYINFKGHVLLKGGLFDYVSCPHYMFEVITWIGWMFISSFSTGSILIFLITSSLIFKSIQIHNEYKHKFKGLYPTNRKAIFPFIL